MKSKVYSNIILILLFGNLVIAQSNGPIFEHLTTNEGLSNNTVLSIHQDKNGFMWFGTLDGLNRFDGIQFKKFRDIPLRYYQRVNPIIEDTLGNLWYGINMLVKYNPETDKHQINYITIDSTLYPARSIDDLTFGPDNKLYVAKNNTIFARDIYSSDSVIYRILKPEYQPVHERIICIEFNSEQQLWMGTDRGFVIFNPANKEISFFDSIDYPEQKFVHDFLFDLEGNLWVAFTDEIAKYSFRNKKTVKYIIPVPGKPVFTDIYQSRDGRIWVGTSAQGAFYLDDKKGQFQCLLEQANVSNIYEDHSNRIWIATENSGIYMYDSLRNYFNRLPIIPENNTLFMFNCDRLMYDENKGLWIGSRGQGLLYYDFGTQKTNIIDNENNLINALYKDGKGNIWYDHLNYLNCYDLQKKTFRKIKYPGSSHLPILNEGNSLTSIITFNNQLIICSDFGQVYSFNPSNETFALIYENKYHNIRVMLVKDNQLMLGVYGLGVLVLDKSFIPVDTFRHNNPDLGLIDHAIMALHYDQFDTLWIGGYGGLSKFNPGTKEFENKFDFNESYNIITSVLEDESGNLWLGSSKGIYKYDRLKQQLILFDSNHGVPPGRFFVSSAAQTKDGTMYFGGNNGIVYFDPKLVKINASPPPVVFTDFIVHKLSSGELKNSRQLLGKDINYVKNIHLKHSENSFTINYAALNFTSPQHNQYKYKLEGLDEDWNFVGNQSQATYTNLNGGKYIFHLQGSNNDSIWNDKERILYIKVDYPPGKTWWAILLYILFTTGIILTVYIYNVRKIRLQHQLEIKNQEAENLLEINNAKSRFFTSISHEFRTPLSLIIDPATRLMQEDKINHNQKKLIKLILNNSKRLLFLINQILDLAKLKSGQLILKAELVDFKTFIKPILHAFSSRAEAMNLEYEIKLPDHSIELWIDREKIEKTLVNLISNAFKFCIKGKITIEVTEETDKVIVKIQDTGIGIAPDEINKVFDEYYQANNPYSQNLAGTGIGLSLVKEYLDLHLATIEVQSQENAGTTFTVALLKGDSHFKAEEINRDTDTTQSEYISVQPITTKLTGDILYSEPGSNKHTVLLIEDNIEMSSYLVDALSATYKMISAENGETGFEKTLEFHPDVVVSDVMMPVMDGYAYCEKVKRDDRTSHIPVILLTARNEHEDKIKGLTLGADDYLGKPFNLDELQLRIKYHIEQCNRIRAQFLSDFKLKSENEFIVSVKDQFLQNVLSHIEAHISDEQFGVEKLSELMFMSRKHLNFKIKTLTQQTPNELIRNFRLRKAGFLLSEKSANVTEVCYEVGFNNLSYFSKCFFEFYGKHPSGFGKS